MPQLENSGYMWEGLPTNLLILFWLSGFPFRACGSSLKFSCMCKLSPSCKFGACWWLMVDCWSLNSRRTHIIALLRCAHPKLHLLVFCWFGIWIAFRVLSSCCAFPHSLGALSTHDIADISKRRLYEQYQLQFEVLDSIEVVGHKICLQCLWCWNCSNLLMPMLVHNLLDLASVLRGMTYVEVKRILEGAHIQYWE